MNYGEYDHQKKKNTFHCKINTFNTLNKRKLKNLDAFKNITVSSDRTMLQRNHLKTVIDELNARKNAGENDIFIKYINNLPNVRGLNTKLDVFSRNIALANYDIIVLSETWLRHE
ncbi:Reverse transcriptase domain-containing protein, partial [Aphis craccivora]